MRIIDADRAKELAEMCMGDIFLQSAVKILIDKVPTIDAVPVVRCKDCKNTYYYKGKLLCTYDDYVRDEDEYCSGGERKENGV